MKKATTWIFPTLGAALAVSMLLAAGEADARDHGQRLHRSPPQVAIDACAEADEGMECSFVGRRGEEIVGTCEVIEDAFACVPEDAPPPPHRGRRNS